MFLLYFYDKYLKNTIKNIKNIGNIFFKEILEKYTGFGENIKKYDKNI